MWGLKLRIFLGSLWLTAGCGQVAGLGGCPPYSLSVPEGSSGRVEINIPKNISTLCKMQTATSSDSACNPIMALNKGTLNYYNSTYKGRIILSDQLLFTVKNASEWLAGEYRVVSNLHGTCMARINLMVPEPRGHYGVWASLVFLAASFAVLYVCWTRGREGPITHHHCEEEGISDAANSPVCMSAYVLQQQEAGTQEPNGEAGEEIPLNREMVQPGKLSCLHCGGLCTSSPL